MKIPEIDPTVKEQLMAPSAMEKISLNGLQTWARCIYIVDGDTVDCIVPTCTMLALGKPYLHLNRVRIRVRGVNTPELRKGTAESKERGQIAKEYVRGLLEDKLVYLVFESNDDFGRALAYIYIDGEDLSQVLIKGGYGVPYMV